MLKLEFSQASNSQQLVKARPHNVLHSSSMKDMYRHLYVGHVGHVQTPLCIDTFMYSYTQLPIHVHVMIYSNTCTCTHVCQTTHDY